jgi:hypothetical protein
VDIFTALAQALAAGLSIWNHKEATALLKRVLELKKDWHEEYNKEKPDDAVLDNVELELCLIANTFYSQAGKQDSPVK